jgi:hypothetical protein
VSTGTGWEPFGVTDEMIDNAELRGASASRDGRRIINLTLRRRGGRDKDRVGTWLRNAMLALGVLAAGAAVVSFQAQYRMVLHAKHNAIVSALEAGIPDVSALIFACLGIALALHGKRAIRARALNVAAVATSVIMNALAASPGWRDLAIWLMPSVAYAVASDTAIAVIRSYTLARQQDLAETLGADETTPLAYVGAFLMWVVRLVLAPPSTLKGFRTWVVEEVPVAPGRCASLPPGTPPLALPPATTKPAPRQPRPRKAKSKTARFLDLVVERYGPLESLPLAEVSRISTELAPKVGLNVGAARSVLGTRAKAARNGGAA